MINESGGISTECSIDDVVVVNTEHVASNTLHYILPIAINTHTAET